MVTFAAAAPFAEMPTASAAARTKSAPSAPLIPSSCSPSAVGGTRANLPTMPRWSRFWTSRPVSGSGASPTRTGTTARAGRRSSPRPASRVAARWRCSTRSRRRRIRRSGSGSRRSRRRMAVVLKPDHVRDVDLFVGRYGARAFGPWLFERQNIPQTELEPIEPGSELPGGLRALYDGRGRNETPLWLPEQRTFVFADALIGAGRRAADLGHAPHRPRAPGAARAARAAVRARDRRPRRAGARPRGIRAGARAAHLARVAVTTPAAVRIR